MSRVQPSPGDRLDSWKEIAAYLNRGVRTVRRWEAVEGLPVHRQVHRTQGSVYAFKSEIETWRQTAARQPVPRAVSAQDRVKSIGVLPFTNLSTDPENAYFADGLTDEVTADLSKVRALRVISRTSSMTFKGTAKNVKTIAGELGARYVLEGSVRRAGGRLRITAQLIDAEADAHLWADKYDGTAVRDLKAALEIDPNNADTLGLLSNCDLISGKVAAARPFIARLLAVDPLTPLNRCMPGFADIMEGQFAPAGDPYRQMFEMDPANPMARLFYVWILLLNQRTGAAAAIVEGFLGEVRGTIPGRIASLLAHAVAGNADGVHAAVSPEVEGVATATDLFPRFLAQGCALAGIPDCAMHWLEIAIGRSFINYPFLAHYDPFFKSLRAHPRFVQLTEIARHRWEAFEA